MDIQRGNSKQRRWLGPLLGGLAVVALASTLYAFGSWGSSSPEVDKDAVWFGTVEHGPMAIEVRAPGRLVPEDERWITATSDGVVERVLVEQGDSVDEGRILIELSNPELGLELLDARLTVRAERAAASALTTRLENEILDLDASIAGLETDLKEAELRRDTDERLLEDGLVPPVDLEIKRYRAAELAARLDIEHRRRRARLDAMPVELEAQQVRGDRAESVLALVERRVGEMRVRARRPGIVTEILPQVGTRVSRGEQLVRVIDPTRLRAELDVPQVKAEKIRVGQQAIIDTRNTRIRGVVTRIDPSVQDGTVKVDVDPEEPLPADVRAALRVDGTIQIENLGDVLHVRRPLNARENSSIDLFRLVSGEDSATRVPVSLGSMSVNTVEVLDGLQAGDRVILSDTSTFSDAKRIRLR